MPILSKPELIKKGIPADFEINKVNLASLPIVVADPYFNDINNWSKIAIIYKNNFGNSETVFFDATEISPSSKFDITDKARGGFEVEAIIIYDFDEDYLLIPKVVTDEIPDLQVAFTTAVSYFISAWRNLEMVTSMSIAYET